MDTLISVIGKGMAMTRRCAECGAEIPPQQGSSRPRKYCVDCRPPRHDPNPRVIPMPAREEPLPPIPELVATYHSKLESAGRLETPEGAHVMHLAVLFVNGSHTAAGAASLSRELRTAMDAALAGVPAQPDALDELAARRNQKMTGA